MLNDKKKKKKNNGNSCLPIKPVTWVIWLEATNLKKKLEA
jgi:hypothetical protein